MLNRANARATIFEAAGDYVAFEEILDQAHERVPIEIFAYCVMPNHWHFVLRPCHDEELSRFMAWLTLTHAQRWHAYRRSAGSGHLYQGRFKSFVVQTDSHLLTVLRYVERNPVRANLVRNVEHWRWGSLWLRGRGVPRYARLVSEWPVPRPVNWIEFVNTPHTERELTALRQSVNRGRPFGDRAWVERTARSLGLESTLRRRGRPLKSAG